MKLLPTSCRAGCALLLVALCGPAAAFQPRVASFHDSSYFDTLPKIGGVSVGADSMPDDGSRVVFAAQSKLVAFDTATLASQVLVEDVGPITDGHISGDGSTLVYTIGNQIFARPAAGGAQVLVSHGAGGVQANGACGVTAVSSSGRYIVFVSKATNLVAGVTGTTFQIFVYDKVADAVTLVSAASGGGSGNADSFNGRVSADGRFIVFDSYATNLTAGGANGQGEVYLRDVISGVTTLASATPGGTAGNGGAFSGSISADGMRVAFVSRATDLIAGGPSGNSGDVFVRTRVTGATTRIVATTAGSGLGATGAMISPDGRYVLYATEAPNPALGDTDNIPDLFLHDLQTSTSVEVARSADGSPLRTDHGPGSVSSGGAWVAFGSGYDGIIGTDNNGLHDTFVKHMPGGAVRQVVLPIAPDAAGDGDSIAPTLDYTGRLLAFATVATNLPLPGQTALVFDVDTHAYGDLAGHFPPTAATGAVAMRFSGNGRFVVAGSRRYDLSMHAEESLDVDGIQRAGGGGVQNDVSYDGRFVAYQTYDAAAPDPARYQVYVADMDALTTAMASLGYNGAAPDGRAFFPHISADGRYVVFQSASTNLLASALPGGVTMGVYRYDRVTGAVVCVSVGAGGLPASGQHVPIALSEDGNIVAFVSNNSTLDAGRAPPAGNQLYFRDMLSGTTTAARTTNGHYVTIDPTKTPTFNIGYAIQAAASADARYFAFWTADALSADDVDMTALTDLYVFDRVSERATMVPGAGFVNAGSLAMSGDARRIAVEAQDWQPPMLYGIDGPSRDVIVLENPGEVVFESGFE